MSHPPNKALLDEINASDRWVHASKTKPLWAKRLDRDEQVKTLEGPEQVMAGNYLCRGPAGEIWPQMAKRLEEKYEPTDDIDSEGWRKYMPHPDAGGVMAIQIPHPFTVQAIWGRLEGKPGDYLVKDFSDKDVSYPDDVWIVDQGIFQATYEIRNP